MPVYSGTSSIARGMREAARISLAALLIGEAWSGIRNRRPAFGTTAPLLPE
jgi:hypothetical protein